MILVTKTSDQARQRGHTPLSTCTINSYLSSEYLVLPPVLPCYSLYYLGWQLLNQPFLLYFFSLATRVSAFSRAASTTILRFLALFRQHDVCMYVCMYMVIT